MARGPGERCLRFGGAPQGDGDPGRWSCKRTLPPASRRPIFCSTKARAGVGSGNRVLSATCRRHL